MKGGFSRQITLNAATFNDMIPYSTLVDEFQYRLFGFYFPAKPGLEAKPSKKKKDEDIDSTTGEPREEVPRRMPKDGRES